MPEIISVAEARRAESVGREVVLHGWIRRVATRRPVSVFWRSTTVPVSATCRRWPRRPCRTTTRKSNGFRPAAASGSRERSSLRPARGRRPKSTPRGSVLGWADAETYPLQKKGHSFEFLRTIAHLRPRTNTFGAVARARNRVPLDPIRVFSRTRFLLRSYADHHGQRLRGRRRMFRSRRSTRPRRRKRTTGRSIMSDFFIGRLI